MALGVDESAECRRAYLLTYQGHPPEVVARLMGVGLDTAEALIQRGRDQTRRLITGNPDLPASVCQHARP